MAHGLDLPGARTQINTAGALRPNTPLSPLGKPRTRSPVRKPNHHYKRLRNAPMLVRVAIGVLLIVGGIFGFLPILGFWMIPLGIAVILIDVPLVKRLFSNLRLKWRQMRGSKTATAKRKER